MKKTLKTFLIICLALFMCMTALVACDNSATPEPKKYTEEEIRTALAENDGTLTIEGTSDNVTAFTFVVTGINANDINPNSLKSAVNILLTDYSKITYGQLKMCYAFSAMVSVDNIFKDDSSEFDEEAYINEIISVICNGNSLQHDNWTISASINQATDSITISATSK